jgi:hypothetical protein
MKEETKNKILYFIIAIFLIGSIGIWLPFVFDIISKREINFISLLQNITTYYIAIIVVSLTDITLNIIRSTKLSNKIGRILTMILFSIIITIYFGFNCYFLWNRKGFVDYFVILGVLLSYILWWVSKQSSKNFKPESALGGETE